MTSSTLFWISFTYNGLSTIFFGGNLNPYSWIIYSIYLLSILLGIKTKTAPFKIRYSSDPGS